MKRGKIISTTKHTAVLRALAIAKMDRSVYKLGAGGKDPEDAEPFTDLGTIYGSDCVGFVLWCLGLDRFQEKLFPLYGGWINTDSIMLDAARDQSFFEFTDKPESGDLVVFPSIMKNGKRIRIGHVAIVTSVDVDTRNWTDHLWERGSKDRATFLSRVNVVDCAGNFRRKLRGKAVQLTTAAASWNKPDARFVRYKKLLPDTLSAFLVNGQRLA